MPAIFLEDAVEVVGVAHLLVLGHLEGDAVEREAVPPRRGEGCADAMGGLVNRARHEIDVQARALLGQAEPARELDRLAAAVLVEAVAVLGRHLAEHAASALARRPAHQRLVGMDAPARECEHGLEGHGEGEWRRDAVRAGAASRVRRQDFNEFVHAMWLPLARGSATHR